MNDHAPSIYKIAVTGHRFISADDRLTNTIRSVLDRLIQDHRNSEIHLFSALAEGSDQLVAAIALSYPGVQLNVPLPLPEAEYLQDFASDMGRQAFHELLQNAASVFTLPPQVDHRTAYEGLGKFLLSHSDVLLALWDGEYTLKKGGTGEVVREALDMGKIIYWIYVINVNGSIQDQGRQP